MNKLFQVITGSEAEAGLSASASYIDPMNKASGNLSRIIIRDLEIMMSIGIYDFEKTKKQPVKINITLDIDQSQVDWLSDMIEESVSYADVIDSINALAGKGHIHMVERFAEDIAELCLADDRVLQAHIRVEKTKIIAEAAGVGVEIIRQR